MPCRQTTPSNRLTVHIQWFECESSSLRSLIQHLYIITTRFTMSPSCLPPMNSSAIRIGMSELSDILVGPQWLDFYIRLIPTEAASPSFWNIDLHVLKVFITGPDRIVFTLLLAQRSGLSWWHMANSRWAFIGGAEGGIVARYHWGWYSAWGRGANLHGREEG